jgi:hypothetical protein
MVTQKGLSKYNGRRGSVANALKACNASVSEENGTKLAWASSLFSRKNSGFSQLFMIVP